MFRRVFAAVAAVFSVQILDSKRRTNSSSSSRGVSNDGVAAVRTLLVAPERHLAPSNSRPRGLTRYTQTERLQKAAAFEVRPIPVHSLLLLKTPENSILLW